MTSDNTTGPPLASSEPKAVLNQLDELVDLVFVRSLEDNCLLKSDPDFDHFGSGKVLSGAVAHGSRRLYRAGPGMPTFAVTTVQRIVRSEDRPPLVVVDIELYGVSRDQLRVPDSMWSVLDQRPWVPNWNDPDRTPMAWIADGYFTAPPNSHSGRAHFGSVIRIVEQMRISSHDPLNKFVLGLRLAPLANWMARVLAELDELCEPDETEPYVVDIEQMIEEFVDEVIRR